MKRSSLISTGVGMMSPLATLELSAIKEEILEFVNAYIDGSEFEKEYI